MTVFVRALPDFRMLLPRYLTDTLILPAVLIVVRETYLQFFRSFTTLVERTRVPDLNVIRSRPVQSCALVRLVQYAAAREPGAHFSGMQVLLGAVAEQTLLVYLTVPAVLNWNGRPASRLGVTVDEIVVFLVPA